MAKTKEIVRTIGTYDADAVSEATGLACLDPSRTVQDQADEADINVILRNFGITGRMPNNVRVPEYGDFEDVGDYRSAIEAVKAAEANFMLMPGEVRARFANDPQVFLEFATDPRNIEEMVKMGLAVKKEVPPDPAAPPAQ